MIADVVDSGLIFIWYAPSISILTITPKKLPTEKYWQRNIFYNPFSSSLPNNFRLLCYHEYATWTVTRACPCVNIQAVEARQKVLEHFDNFD
jgi:hypothetical protein